MLKTLMAALLVAASAAAGSCAEIKKTIKLPAPQINGGMPLMEALSKRKSDRSFKTEKLSQQTLSNLLWAAFGINRPKDSKRTAPSAKNMQEIEIYVVLEEASYLYNAKSNSLEFMAGGDLRALTGSQDFVKDAPLNLVFVADKSKMSGVNSGDIAFYTGIDTGYISQNVYLFCASEGLSTVARAWVDKEALSKALKLGKDKLITLSQTVGYPK